MIVNSVSKFFWCSLNTVQAEETMETQFLLSEQVYARAKVIFYSIQHKDDHLLILLLPGTSN